MMKMNPTANDGQQSETSGKKPQLALAIATVFGIGNLPKAPGTFGSLVGVAFALISHPVSWITAFGLLFGSFGFGVDLPNPNWLFGFALLGLPSAFAFLILAILGVWSSSRVCEFAGCKDPQYVVIDEVSGQHLTYLFGIMFLPLPNRMANNIEMPSQGLVFTWRILNWKCLLLGFILFRVFDIWKPWPIRRLEKLPRGWGIMADDWMAGIYAAILLRFALHFNLV